MAVEAVEAALKLTVFAAEGLDWALVVPAASVVQLESLPLMEAQLLEKAPFQ